MVRTNAYLRKDGRWEVRVRFDGEKNFKYFYGADKETAERKAEIFLEGIIPPADNDLTKNNFLLRDLAEEWFSSKKPCTKESTRTVYRMKLDKHIIPFFEDMTCGDVTAKKICDFINRKLEDELSPRYVSDILIVLKAIFKYGSIHYDIKNVTDGIIVPKINRSKTMILNKVQQIRLKEYLSAHLSLTAVCVLFALEFGLRIGEICGLKWSDIDFENALLHVNRTVQRISSGSGKTRVVISDPKSLTSKRSIPIPAWFLDILKNFKSDKNDFILSGCGKPLEPRTLQYRFAAILKKADLPSVKFHSLRHAFATNAVKLGFDTKALSEILGHSSVEITLNKYVHPDMELKRSYMERMTESA